MTQLISPVLGRRNSTAKFEAGVAPGVFLPHFGKGQGRGQCQQQPLNNERPDRGCPLELHTTYAFSPWPWRRTIF
eukprot:3838119-Amphidinium_carterae.2